MRRTLLLAALAGTLVAPAASAQAPAGKPDLERAQTIAKEVCAACHGADGNSATSANPIIAGQPAEYITLQLSHFKSGLRANPVMQAMAATLQPDEMKALGVYFSQQKPKGLAAKDPALVTAGQKLFRGGDSRDGRSRLRGLSRAERRRSRQELSAPRRPIRRTTPTRSSRRSRPASAARTRTARTSTA